MFKKKIKVVTTGLLLLVAVENLQAAEMHKKDFECVKSGKTVGCKIERFTRSGLDKVKSGEQWTSHLTSTFKATTSGGESLEKTLTFENKPETIIFNF